MECDLNGLQRIRYVNGHVDILYSYDVSFAVQYMYISFTEETDFGVYILRLEGSDDEINMTYTADQFHPTRHPG